MRHQPPAPDEVPDDRNLTDRYGRQRVRSTVERLGSTVPVASVYSDAGMDTGGTAHYRTGQRLLSRGYGGTEVSRRHLLHLGQPPRSSASGPRSRPQAATRQDRSFDAARPLKPA